MPIPRSLALAGAITITASTVLVGATAASDSPSAPPLVLGPSLQQRFEPSATKVPRTFVAEDGPLEFGGPRTHSCRRQQ